MQRSRVGCAQLPGFSTYTATFASRLPECPWRCRHQELEGFAEGQAVLQRDAAPTQSVSLVL
eukprot:6481867-Amphidinium_carterae.2